MHTCARVRDTTAPNSNPHHIPLQGPLSHGWQIYYRSTMSPGRGLVEKAVCRLAATVAGHDCFGENEGQGPGARCKDASHPLYSCIALHMAPTNPRPRGSDSQRRLSGFPDCRIPPPRNVHILSAANICRSGMVVYYYHHGRFCLGTSSNPSRTQSSSAQVPTAQIGYPSAAHLIVDSPP